MKYLPGRVLLRFGFIRHTKQHLFLNLPGPSDRLGANVIYALFPQKSFAKKFSKIQGQIILWRSFVKFKSRVRSFFFVDFLLILLSFWAEFTDLFTQLWAKMIHSVPNPESYLSITFHLMIFNYTVIFNHEVL